MQGPITPEDLVTHPEQFELDDCELSPEQLAQIDEAILEADRLIAAGVRFTTANEFFEKLKRQHRLAS